MHWIIHEYKWDYGSIHWPNAEDAFESSSFSCSAESIEGPHCQGKGGAGVGALYLEEKHAN